MSVLTRARTHAAELIKAAGVRCTAFEPERVTPDLAYVTPGAPYLTTADPGGFGELQHRLTVRVVTQTATAQVASARLDELIEAVAAALDGSWDVAEVSEPFIYLAGGKSYAAADVTVTDTIRLTD